VRKIELPMRLKGMGLSPDGNRIFWNRCYWYESWQMDLATGKVTRRPNFGGSHAGGGGGLRLGHHQGLIISAPVGNIDPAPGDKVKIFLNFRSGWHTDYGHLSGDRRRYVANGTAGDMTNQLIMTETGDPGAVKQVAFQNTSRNNWGNNTVIRSSTDTTKLTWVSNIWGYDAVCMTFTRRPEPVYNFTGKREADAVALRWEPPRRSGGRVHEVMGYNLYRSVENGPFLPLNRVPMKATSYRDVDVKRDKLTKYIVCAQEHCGLEGLPSNAFVAMPTVVGEERLAAHQIHVEPELGIYVTPPARRAFGGYTSGFRYVRIRKQVETETTGSVQVDFHPSVPADYVVWLRVRAEGEPGKWHVRIDPQLKEAIAVQGPEWKWIRTEKRVKLDAGKRTRVVVASADEGLCVDKIILAQDPNYVPKTIDDRFNTRPARPKHLDTEAVTSSSVHLAWWNPRAEKDVAYYNVYVGETPAFPTDQAHRIASTRKSELLDWGLAPDKAYTYKLTAVNRRGLESPATALTVKTEPVPQRVLLELPIDRATLDERLKIETKGGVRYAFRPYEGKGHDKDPLADITWTFDVPVNGRYMIWCQYAPADQYYTRLRVPVLLDDFLKGKAIWQMRTPYRAMSGPRYRLWKEDLWFVDRVSMYVWPKARDFFRLSAGRHKLTLRMNPVIKEFHHKIGKVWITNDPSFRPPGWDPQADFKKAKLKRR